MNQVPSGEAEDESGLPLTVEPRFKDVGRTTKP